MAHGHDVLHMMEGNKYESKEQLVTAIIEKFGVEERFHTCSAAGMDATEMVEFLAKKGKFIVANEGAFTVDTTKICNH